LHVVGRLITINNHNIYDTKYNKQEVIFN